MAFTVLERLLTTERIHQRAGKLGHSLPALQERPASVEEGPFLSTNMKRNFLPTRLSSAGYVRFGFSYVPVGEDDSLLPVVHQAISALGSSSRCISLADAMTRLRANHFDPRTMVLPASWLPEMCGPDFDPSTAMTLQASQGFVAQVEDVQVMVADIPDRMALVATIPPLVGRYTRIGDHLGLLFLRADRAIVAVTRDMAR